MNEQVQTHASKYACLSFAHEQQTRCTFPFSRELSVPHPDEGPTLKAHTHTKKWRPHEIQEGIKIFERSTNQHSGSNNNNQPTMMMMKKHREKNHIVNSLLKRNLRQWFDSHAFTKWKKNEAFLVDLNVNTHQIMQYAQWLAFYWIWYSCIVCILY